MGVGDCWKTQQFDRDARSGDSDVSAVKRAALDVSTTKAQSAMAGWRDAAKANREVAKRARTIARRMRDAVYSMYTRDDPRIGDYGLATPVKPKSRKPNGAKPADTKVG